MSTSRTIYQLLARRTPTVATRTSCSHVMRTVEIARPIAGAVSSSTSCCSTTTRSFDVHNSARAAGGRFLSTVARSTSPSSTGALGSPSNPIRAVNVPLSEVTRRSKASVVVPSSSSSGPASKSTTSTSKTKAAARNAIIDDPTADIPQSGGFEKFYSSVAFDRDEYDPDGKKANRHSDTDGLNDNAHGTSLDDAEFLNDAGIDRTKLIKLASQRATPLRLADMYQYGSDYRNSTQRMKNAQFLHRELPIRIAQRIVDLLTLPYGLSEATPVRQVVRTYMAYLKDLQAMPSPTTVEEEEQFTDLLQSFVLDRSTIPTWIARGVASWRDDFVTRYQGSLSGNVENNAYDAIELTPELERLQQMEDALYRFFTARVGLRFLIEHHVLSSKKASTNPLWNVTHMFPPEDPETENRRSGCIHNNIDLVKETRKVADEIIRQTNEYYGMCPKIEIVDCKTENYDQSFTYVPHHLHYMLAELLKNSCRATVKQYLNEELHGNKSNAKLVPIRVIIVKGEEDVTIKIADKAGGIPRSLMAKIWKFGQSIHDDDAEYEPIVPAAEPSTSAASKTSAKSTTSDDSSTTAAGVADFGTDEFSKAKIRGFGLPLARIYARYFGGELNLKSMEGYGVDAYLHLPRLGDGGENLPARVRTSPGELDSTPSYGGGGGGGTASSSSASASASNQSSNARSFATNSQGMSLSAAAQEMRRRGQRERQQQRKMRRQQRINQFLIPTATTSILPNSAQNRPLPSDKNDATTVTPGASNSSSSGSRSQGEQPVIATASATSTTTEYKQTQQAM